MRSSSDLLDQMLGTYIWFSETFHTWCPDIRELRQLLCDVTHDEKVRILKKRAGALYAATRYGHTRIITTILSSVPQHQRLHVLCGEECKRKPLHSAAECGHSDCVKTILTHLTPEQQLKILSERDCFGDTPAEAASQNLERETERLLGDYKPRAEKQIREAKYKTLIFYTKEGREDGAMEEATLLESSLNKVIGHVNTQEWSTVAELEDKLHTNITGLSAKCSLLFISVMSHGRMGALCGPDGVMLPVKDLIDQISRVIPANLPLVLLVQACQNLDTDESSGSGTDAASLETDAKRGSAVGCEHIELARPNTVLLMATASRGAALRGAYIKALSAEIGKADGKKQMYDMHSDAVKAMRKEMGADLDDINQRPKYTDIMEGKKLILPKACK